MQMRGHGTNLTLLQIYGSPVIPVSATVMIGVVPVSLTMPNP